MVGGGVKGHTECEMFGPCKEETQIGGGSWELPSAMCARNGIILFLDTFLCFTGIAFDLWPPPVDFHGVYSDSISTSATVWRPCGGKISSWKPQGRFKRAPSWPATTSAGRWRRRAKPAARDHREGLQAQDQRGRGEGGDSNWRERFRSFHFSQVQVHVNSERPQLPKMSNHKQTFLVQLIIRLHACLRAHGTLTTTSRHLRQLRKRVSRDLAAGFHLPSSHFSLWLLNLPQRTFRRRASSYRVIPRWRSRLITETLLVASGTFIQRSHS